MEATNSITHARKKLNRRSLLGPVLHVPSLAPGGSSGCKVPAPLLYQTLPAPQKFFSKLAERSFCPVDGAHVPVSHSILSISANLKTSGVHAYGTVHDLPILINPQSWLWLKLRIHDAFTFHCSLSVSNASLISVELQLCGAFLHCRQFLDLESWRTSNAARRGLYWML